MSTAPIDFAARTATSSMDGFWNDNLAHADPEIAAAVAKEAKDLEADAAASGTESYEAKIIQVAQALAKEKSLKAAIKKDAAALHLKTKATIESLLDYGTVPVINIKGIAPGQMKLDGQTLGDIFLGKITRWNDPQIVAANPDLKLSDTPITVVVRADSSGTTAVFTKHLAAINPEFNTTLGEGNTVNWPATDKFIKSPKNDGVTATVRQTPGAIGYIEYGFAKLAKVDFAMLQNKAGQYVVPNAESGAEALAAVNMPENLVAWLPDPDGAKSYPITSYTWMIFRKDNGNPEKAKAMREMVEYSLTEGQKIADSMGYIPLPPSVVDQVRKASANIQ